MTKYLINRIILSIFTYVVFITLVFFMLDLVPGDFSDVYLSDPRLTPAEREQIATNLGLNKPVGERYLEWVLNLFQGELGTSFSNFPRPVSEVIAERAPRTLLLFISAIIVSWYTGFSAGKWLAWHRGGLTEYLVTIGGVSLYTVFTPWFGLTMIWIFAFTLDIFPTGKFLTPGLWRDAPEWMDANWVFIRLLVTLFAVALAYLLWILFLRRIDPIQRRKIQWIGPVAIAIGVIGYWFFMTGSEPCAINVAWRDAIDWSFPGRGASCYVVNMSYHLILPIITLTLVSFAGTMLLTRNSMLETLREDYIMTARAKGLPEKVIRDKHAARNALLPVVTSLVFALAFALDGGVITETVFSWPGMGLTLVQAAQLEDIPMVVGTMVFTGTLVLMAHLFVDILYAYLDPRIRYS